MLITVKSATLAKANQRRIEYEDSPHFKLYEFRSIMKLSDNSRVTGRIALEINSKYNGIYNVFTVVINTEVKGFKQEFVIDRLDEYTDDELLATGKQLIKLFIKSLAF